MTIAICDDDREFLEIMRTEVHNIFKENLLQVEVLIYDNADDLLKDIAIKCIYTVFLDIDMPGMNGFELSERLKMHNENVQIVFVTSYEVFMHKAFDFRPFGYVRKNKLNQELKNTIKRLEQHYENTNVFIELCNKNEHAKWRLSDIYYFESQNNDIIAYGKMGKFKFRGRLAMLERQYNQYGFVLINRGLLVNLRYMVKMSKSNIILSNQTELPISKSRYATVKNEYLMHRDNLY